MTTRQISASTRDARFKGWLTASIVATAAVAFAAVNAGTMDIPFDVVLSTLFGRGTPESELTLFQFRLPRIAMAILVGMGIAVSGAILQGVAQNPLADPGILGINSGAGFAVVLYMFFFQNTAFLTGWLSVFLMPLTALAGAFLAAILIYVLSLKDGRVTPIRLLLMGIGINAAFGAGLIILQMKMEPVDFMKAIVWLSGTIWGTNWTFVWALLPWILILLPWAIYRSSLLDVLRLGDPLAIGLGARTESARRGLLIVAVALAGSCVAVGGGITFLGLLAPHIARRLVGAAHARVLPLSAALGALLLLSADTAGRVVMAPMELPVGIVVSILGAPYFIYLLIREA